MGHETPDQRINRLRTAGSIGGSRYWALINEQDKATHLQKLNDGRLAKYLAQVDEKVGPLPEDERMKRALALRKADMQALALRSARSRRASRIDRALARQDAEIAALIDGDGDAA